MRNQVGPFSENSDWPEGQERPEAELLHEGLHHLLREGYHVVDTHVSVVVPTKRDTFLKISVQNIQPCKISSLNIEKQKVMPGTSLTFKRIRRFVL